MGCLAVFKTGYLPAFLLAAAAAGLATFFAAGAVLSGLLRPMETVSSFAKCFAAPEYNMKSMIPKEGWPEAKEHISILNRLLLELSSFRSFNLSQVVEDRAKAQALIETITDGVLLVEESGKLIYSNQKALSLLGIARQEHDIVLPGSVRKEAFSAALAGMMESKEPNIKTEVEIKGLDETDSVAKIFQILARPFVLATLKKPGRIIILREVTVEKEIESARETLFHMITHDMRAPLSSIRGYAQMMQKAVAGTPAAEKCLNVILRSSLRLNGMIEDILNTIKLEHGDMKLVPVTVDGWEMCARVLEVHAPLAARKDMKLTALPPPERVEFAGDVVLLERVITNILGNSLKFTPESGTVSLSCRKEGGEAIFCIEDNGPGIPKEKHAEIFEKYGQLEEHKFMGFGLGLAMCKMAVELHKGRIWIESEVGKGSKFSFAIPMNLVTEAPAAAPAAEPGK